MVVALSAVAVKLSTSVFGLDGRKEECLHNFSTQSWLGGTTESIFLAVHMFLELVSMQSRFVMHYTEST